MKRKVSFLKYACFHCRKAFSRVPKRFGKKELYGNPRWGNAYMREVFVPEITATCPQCAGPMYWMGRDFKAPPQSKVKAWQRWEVVAQRRYISWLSYSPELADKIDPYFSKQKE